jgi:hypothetical protein
MKKLLLFVLVLAGVSLSSQAQRKFYYYPSQNVYYDVSQKQYVYQNSGNWTPVAALPDNIKSAMGSRYVVYNQTPEVWNQNAEHVKKYKAPKQKNVPNGRAYGHKGTNPNKANGLGNGNGNGNGKGNGNGHGNGKGNGNGKH